MGLLENASASIYSKIYDTDIASNYIVEDKDRNKLTVSRAQSDSLLKSSDRTLRLNMFKEKYKYFLERKHTLAETYSSVVNKDKIMAKIKKYNSSIEMALFKDNVSVDIYNNLILTVHNNLSIMHRFINIYKKKLGVQDFHIYDFDSPIIDEPPTIIHYQEGMRILDDCFKVLGADYVNDLNNGFNARWVDVYPSEGKTNLPCTGSIYGCHPYVLINYRDDISSLIVLSHEIGHAMNTHYAFNEQPYAYAYYSPFVGEIVSQVNEVILMEYLIKKEKDTNVKVYLILKYLKLFYSKIIRQTMLAEFEKIVHERCEKGEGIATSDLCNTYKLLINTYFGSELIIDYDLEMEWATIPHIFKNPFYVYTYATGFAAAVAISAKIIEGDKEFIEAYLDFLKKGASDYPIEVIKTLVLDLTTSETMQSAFNKFKELLNELELLI